MKKILRKLFLIFLFCLLAAFCFLVWIRFIEPNLLQLEKLSFKIENLALSNLTILHLTDFQGLDQESAAKLMNVSRQTFGRILAEARATVADALVMGKTLRIEGGHFMMPPRGRHRHRWRGGF